jgi:hypothetical protein
MSVLEKPGVMDFWKDLASAADDEGLHHWLQVSNFQELQD